MFDFITHINWVDILILGVLFRVCFIARAKGFVTEVFKTAGMLSAIYLSLHYYASLSDFLQNTLGLDFMPVEFIDFLSFLVLAVFGSCLFWGLREASLRAVSVEAVPTLSSWGGVVLGILRAVLLASLIIYAMAISSITYLKKSAVRSFLGRPLFSVSTNVYGGLWNGIISKFMVMEKFNDAVKDTEENLDSFDDEKDEEQAGEGN